MLVVLRLTIGGVDFKFIYYCHSNLANKRVHQTIYAIRGRQCKLQIQFQVSLKELVTNPALEISSEFFRRNTDDEFASL